MKLGVKWLWDARGLGRIRKIRKIKRDCEDYQKHGMQFGWNRFCDRLRDESGFDGVTPTLPMSQCHIYDLPLKCQIHQKSYRLSFRIHPAHISLEMAWNNFWIAKLWSKLEQGWCGDMFPWIPIREVLTLSATHLTTKLIFSETLFSANFVETCGLFCKKKKKINKTWY